MGTKVWRQRQRQQQRQRRRWWSQYSERPKSLRLIFFKHFVISSNLTPKFRFLGKVSKYVNIIFVWFSLPFHVHILPNIIYIYYIINNEEKNCKWGLFPFGVPISFVTALLLAYTNPLKKKVSPYLSRFSNYACYKFVTSYARTHARTHRRTFGSQYLESA